MVIYWYFLKQFVCISGTEYTKWSSGHYNKFNPIISFVKRQTFSPKVYTVRLQLYFRLIDTQWPWLYYYRKLAGTVITIWPWLIIQYVYTYNVMAMIMITIAITIVIMITIMIEITIMITITIFGLRLILWLSTFTITIMIMTKINNNNNKSL